MEEFETEAAVIDALVRRSLDCETVSVERGSKEQMQLLLVPDGNGGKQVVNPKKYLDEYLDVPERKQGTARHTNLSSFIDHANRFKDADSTLWADQDGPSLTAVLDYHRQDGNPRFGAHRGIYSFPLSDEWTAWRRADGNSFDQGLFAEFVEDRIADFADPSDASESIKKFAAQLGCALATPVQIMSLSRGLSVNVGRNVAQHSNLSSGEISVQFKEEHTDAAGKPLKVPGACVLGIPVFKLGTRYQVPVRLRYRVNKGISWSFSLYRTDLCFEDAFKEAAETAAAATQLPLFYGRPE